MPNYHVSITMALPKGDVPEQLTSLEDLTAICKVGEALDTWSRRNWLLYAVDLCASHYGFPHLSYLNQQAAVLDPTKAKLAAQDLSSLLTAIKEEPASLSALLGQDAWSIQEINAMLIAHASPWGPLVETDDGDDLPYLLSFLLSQLALLQHAIDWNLYVAFAQSPDA